MTRLDSIIERIEKGEPIDWRQESQLVALDLVRVGEEFVRETLERHRESDERLQREYERTETAE